MNLRNVILPIALLLLAAAHALAQQPSPTPIPADQRDDVIRINTDLVQTDVVVLDRTGRFVEGLQRDQFELRVDNKPQTISFFDLIQGGSAAEDKQLKAARGKPSSSSSGGGAVKTSMERRTIGFFVDDAHLSPESILRARKLLLNFINESMRSGDQVLIASSSGDLGFLQQFTESKEVLRAAAQRLRYHSQSRLDTTVLPMTVYEAQAIDLNDSSIINRKVNELMASTYSTARKSRMLDLTAMAEQEVRNTARQILRQATTLNSSVLMTVESLARGASVLPGRKLVFFLSDGFILDKRYAEGQIKFQRVVDAAARSGVVIYSVDTRGLFTAFADASTEVFSGETYSETRTVEVVASQEILRTLASDTGGRAILNSNDLEGGVAKALEETSTYYLISWHPEQVAQGKPLFHRLDVSIKDRPELKVFARRGFFDVSEPPAAVTKRNASGANDPSTELNRALSGLYPRRDLHVSLYAAFLNDAQSGSVLAISGELAPDDFQSESSEQKEADVNVAYVLLNAAGKALSSSEKKLTWVTAPADPRPFTGRPIVTEFAVPIVPGLYQVRLSARDNVSGRIGGAYKWIEIPEFAPKRLSLSTLLLSEQRSATSPDNAPSTAEEDRLDVSRNFARTSSLLVQTFVYNASVPNSGGAPQVTMQLGIYWHNKLVASSPANPLVVSNGTDPTRIPCAIELPLRKLPAGQYNLQVTAVDRVTNTSVTQTMDFTVE
ncbi:MAG: VWA domain-containing protein [Pyrinomonadaceae bacterium]